MPSQRKGSVHLMFIVSLKHDSCERVKGTIAVLNPITWTLFTFLLMPGIPPGSYLF